MDGDTLNLNDDDYLSVEDMMAENGDDQNAVADLNAHDDSVTSDAQTKGVLCIITQNATEGKSALDVYLAEPPMDYSAFPKLDVLRYWKNNKSRYKELSSMAFDVLCIPITTVSSESSFSAGSRVLTRYRSRLLSSNVQALICTRNWIRGFEPMSDSEDEEEENEGENEEEEEDEKEEEGGRRKKKKVVCT